MKEYGILYARVVLPKEHRLHWLSHCNLTGMLPKDLQEEIKTLSSEINSKYKDVIIPMDNSIIPVVLQNQKQSKKSLMLFIKGC